MTSRKWTARPQSNGTATARATAGPITSNPVTTRPTIRPARLGFDSGSDSGGHATAGDVLSSKVVAMSPSVVRTGGASNVLRPGILGGAHAAMVTKYFQNTSPTDHAV